MSAPIQSDVVFNALRGEILACRLAPSAKIKIGAICSQFGVSLGAAREALSRLVADGLVRNEAQRGFFVAPVSAKELHDLTAARTAIEGLCLDAAIDRASDGWRARIAATQQQLARIDPCVPGRPDELNPIWSAAHHAFHAALVAACDNGVLLRIRDALYDESERYRHWCLPLSKGVERRDVAGEHRAIAEAVLAQDRPASKRLITEHFRRTEEILALSPMLAGHGAPEPASRRAAGV